MYLLDTYPLISIGYIFIPFNQSHALIKWVFLWFSVAPEVVPCSQSVPGSRASPGSLVVFPSRSHCVPQPVRRARSPPTGPCSLPAGSLSSPPSLGPHLYLALGHLFSALLPRCQCCVGSSPMPVWCCRLPAAAPHSLGGSTNIFFYLCHTIHPVDSM